MPEPEKPQPEGPAKAQPQLSDEERRRLWRKAVMEKAKQIKQITDVAIIAMLGLAILAHLLPFVRPLKIKTYEIRDEKLKEKWDVIEQKRGYRLVVDLLLPYGGDASVLKEDDPYWKNRLPEPPEISWGVQPRVVYSHHPTSGERLVDRYGKPWEKRFRNVYPATLTAYLLLLVSLGAVVVLVLYVVDFKLWMGRFLPVLSCVYGFGSVLYLMATRVPAEGSWNALRYGSGLARHGLLVPLFLVGSFSILRYVVSQRWKRYVWAGLEIPEHLRPPEPEEGEKAARRGRVATAKAAATPKREKEKAEGEAEKEKGESAKDEGSTQEGKGKEAEKSGEGGEAAKGDSGEKGGSGGKG